MLDHVTWTHWVKYRIQSSHYHRLHALWLMPVDPYCINMLLLYHREDRSTKTWVTSLTILCHYTNSLKQWTRSGFVDHPHKAGGRVQDYLYTSKLYCWFWWNSFGVKFIITHIVSYSKIVLYINFNTLITNLLTLMVLGS